MLIEQSKKILQYLAQNRPTWKIILEDENVRIVTGQLVLGWNIFRDMETEFKVVVYDVIFTPNYGITISMRFRD